jgi:hypothetical protein
MPIDTSIYQNLRPVQMPSTLDSQAKAMNLSNHALQQAHTMKQMSREDEAQQMADRLRKASEYGQALDSLAGLPEPERAKAWGAVRGELVKNGAIAPDTAPEQYDPGFFRTNLSRYYATKDGIESRLKQAQTKKLEAEATMAGTKDYLQSDLTRSQIAKNYADAKKEGGPKQLPADKVLSVSEGQRLPTMLEDIRSTISSNADSFGPIAGRIGAANPYNERTKTIDAQMRASAQSFGRFMEGGVLRKEDEAKYRQMFPNLSDTPEVAANKLTIVDRLLRQKQSADVEALRSSGYDTAACSKAGTAPSAPEVLKGAKSGKDGVAYAAEPPPAPKQGEVQDGYVFMGGNPNDQKSWKKAR